MFTPLTMRHVSLLVVREQAAEAALTLARLGVFQPQVSDISVDELPELPARDYQQLVSRADAHLDKILSHFHLSAAFPDGIGTPPAESRIEAIDEQLSEIWQSCSQRDEQIRKYQEQAKHLRHLQQSLDTFAALDIDLALLHREHHFLDLRVGTMPPANLQQLTDAVSLAGYHLSPFEQSDDYVNVLLMGPIEHAAQIKPALEAAGWQPLPVPDELSGHPEQIRAELQQQLQAVDEARQQIEQQRDQARQHLAGVLDDISRTLALARPYARLAESLRGRGGLALVTGWVPALDVAALAASLRQDLGEAHYLRIRPPLPAEHSEVPTACRHARWLQPFVSLVKNYGVPRYGEFDPSLLFAISYVAMFGMMFGDVGHGLVILSSAPLLRGRFPRVVPFVALCGLSSMLFGLLYGSIFGYEHLIEALWLAPLSDPVYMLKVAMLVGVGFILLATVLAIRNRLADGDIRRALLPGNGVTGLVFYLSLLWLAWSTADGETALPALLLSGASLALIMGYSGWENRRAALVERLLIMLVETFETMMNYVSGTLSYLRLAAFSLNHVALAIAVFTLANMLDTGGYWVTVVLGNLFILVMEGAIVMIQALRLEYYEGFSRFFSGNGQEFRPLRLTEDKT